MRTLKSLKIFSKKTIRFLNVDNVLAVLFAIFIVFNINTPDWLSNLTNHIFVQVLLGLAVVCLFFTTNPIVGILGLLALYELIKRARNGGHSGNAFQPSEYKKKLQFDSFNQWPKTLEEDVISNMAPLPTYSSSGLQYQPDEEYVNGSDV